MCFDSERRPLLARNRQCFASTQLSRSRGSERARLAVGRNVMCKKRRLNDARAINGQIEKPADCASGGERTQNERLAHASLPTRALVRLFWQTALPVRRRCWRARAASECVFCIAKIGLWA